jgi:molecular chaperone GrpE
MTDSEKHPDLTTPPGPTEPCREDQAAVRARILRRFETWLDDVLVGEQPIEGIAAEILAQLEAEPTAGEPGGSEAGCDLCSLWSAVTAMAEETRLQGRAFKQLHESLAPMQGLVESVAGVLQRYMTSLEQQDQRLNETTRQAVWKEVLGTLLDMRDRLVRGADTARTWLAKAQTPPKLGLATRLRQKIVAPAPQVRKEHEEAVQSLLKGYALGQEVLDEALARFGVRPMDCVGRPFDPGSRKAVDLDLQSDAAEGTVLEVYRQGYWWHDAVYRPAEVKVAKKREV